MRIILYWESQALLPRSVDLITVGQVPFVSFQMIRLPACTYTDYGNSASTDPKQLGTLFRIHVEFCS